MWLVSITDPEGSVVASTIWVVEEEEKIHPIREYLRLKLGPSLETMISSDIANDMSNLILPSTVITFPEGD